MAINYNNDGQIRTVLDDENIWDLLYPINSLFWTMTDADNISEILKAPDSVSTRWEWIKVKGFVYALTDNDSAINAINKIKQDNKIERAGDEHEYSGIKLTVDNLPEHNHIIEHTHTRGSMNITGDFSAQVSETWQTKSGAFSYNGESTHCDGGKSAGTYANGFHFDASKTWNGETSNAIVNGSETPISSKTGGNKTYDWMPPFTAAYCWRRIK